jgi:hypothetical protein
MSTEHALRSFDRHAETDSAQVERLEKSLGDYQAQANKPYEHEAKLKEMLARHAQLSAILDLDKGEKQIAPDDGGEEPEIPNMSFADRAIDSRSSVRVR